MENQTFAPMEQMLDFPYLQTLSIMKYIIENGAFAPMEQMLDFPWYFHKHIVFQRHQKALPWGKGLIWSSLIPNVPSWVSSTKSANLKDH